MAVRPRLDLPKIVFGTSGLGNIFKALPDATKREIIARWFAQGLPLVVADSAGKYGAGLALEVMGRELEALGVPPEKILISNKLAWRRAPLVTPEPTFEPGVWVDIKHDAVQDISGPGIIRCLEEGDALLGKYRSGLGSVHDPDEYLAAAKSPAEREERLGHILEAYRALEKLRDEGKILGVGIGSKDWRVIREIAALVKLDWVMFANSLTVYRHEDELLDFVEKLRLDGVAVINSAVFHAGYLVGGEFFDYRKVDGTEPWHAEVAAWRAKFNAACAKYGVKPAHACVQFSFRIPGIRSVALSTTRPDAVAENVRMTTEELPEDFWRFLASEGLLSERVTRILTVAR